MSHEHSMTNHVNDVDELSYKETLHVLEEYSQLLINDKPTIECALKNTVALISGKNMSRYDSDYAVEGSIDDRLNKLPVDVTVEIAVSCARIIMKEFSLLKLPLIEEWILQHPQLEQQTGIARIEQIAQYKVAKLLHDRMKVENGKVCKLFGRLFVEWSGCCRGIVASDLCSSYTYPEVLELFMDLFTASLGDGVIHGVRQVNSKDDRYVQLVWSCNMQESLQQSQRRRKAAIDDRIISDTNTFDSTSTNSERL